MVTQFFPLPMQIKGRQSGQILSTFSQLTDISPLELKGKELAVIEEMLARYYLEIRYEQIPDVNEMRYRWGLQGPVRGLSKPALYGEFSVNLQKKLEDLPDVVITTKVNEVRRTGRNSFSIDFTIYKNFPNGRRSAEEKNAALEFDYRGRRFFSPSFVNPYGLRFTSFKEADIKK